MVINAFNYDFIMFESLYNIYNIDFSHSFKLRASRVGRFSESLSLKLTLEPKFPAIED